jgi:multicomponent Na+:H+ antiporter subunit D
VNTLLTAPVFVPFLGATVALIAARHRRVQQFVSLVVLAAVVGLSVSVLTTVLRDGPSATRIGGWPASIGIIYVADTLSALMLVISALLMLAVMVFAIGQRADTRSPWFHPSYLVLSGGIAMAFLTGDLFNLFVAFEVLLIASYVLLTLNGDRRQVRAGMTYVVMNLLESTLLVAAIALVYGATGTVNMALIAERMGDVPDGVRYSLQFLLLIAFGMKAAIFPLFFWLPDSYPTAASPVTAVFAGLLTKIGVYALIRVQTLIFPSDTVSIVLLTLAALTMVVGVIGAIAQKDMKRILSFHIVSQIGYMLLGLGIGGIAGLAACVFFVLHQIPVKTSLFLVEGIVETDTGTSDLNRVGGVLHRSGWLAVMFGLSALSLAGVPPLSGFVGKIALVEAGFSNGATSAMVVTAISLAVSILTLFSMTKIWAGVFWGKPESVHPLRERLRMGRAMGAATAAVVVIGLFIAIAAGPIYDVSRQAAEELDGNDAYITAVTGVPDGLAAATQGGR